ncbi:MAG TPA: STAS domain-containing protein [Solirubrobacteraceae bacterium]|nr:STAS domain-containing protein [Solirubrobacteraceae bacterium]
MSSKDPVGLRVREISQGGTCALILSGELDLATRPLLDAALQRLERRPIDTLILDLGALAFMDSTGLHAVLVAKAICARRGCEFLMVPGSTQVQRLFALSGVHVAPPLSGEALTA